MTTTTFDPADDLIIVESRIWGHAGYKDISLALDTGSASTMIRADLIDDIGYSPRDGIAITTVRSAVGAERGYTLRVARFAALGFELENFKVHVFDLPTGFGIDGLLGLSFLRRLDYEIRSIVGTIRAQPAVSA